MAQQHRIRDHLRQNVIGYLALFVALGGTGAWAADQITSEDIADNAVRSRHIKQDAVRTAKIADGAVTAPKLAEGVGADGTARAYARVLSDAGYPCTGGPFEDSCTFDHAKGVADVYRAQNDPTGIYCVDAPGISSTSVPAAVTVDWTASHIDPGEASAMIAGNNVHCGAGLFEVFTQRHGDGSAVFASDVVGFTIVIP